MAGLVHDEHDKRGEEVVEQGAHRFPEPELRAGLCLGPEAPLRDHGKELPEHFGIGDRPVHPPEGPGPEHAEHPVVGAEELPVEVGPDLLPVGGGEAVYLVPDAPADGLELGERKGLDLPGDGVTELAPVAGLSQAGYRFAHAPESSFISAREGGTVAGYGHQQWYDLVVPAHVTISISSSRLPSGTGILP